MALTVCGACDKTYGEYKPECPHCGKNVDQQIATMRTNIALNRAWSEGYKEALRRLCSFWR